MFCQTKAFRGIRQALLVEEQLAGRREPTQFGRALDQLGISYIAAQHHERSVSNDNVVQWDGRRFQIPPHPQHFSFAGAKVQLMESLEGKVSIYYGTTKLLHSSGEIHSGG